MNLVSLDSSRRDESNDMCFTPVALISTEILDFKGFYTSGQVRVKWLTRSEISGRVGSGTRTSGQKFGALYILKNNILYIVHTEIQYLTFYRAEMLSTDTESCLMSSSFELSLATFTNHTLRLLALNRS